MSFSSPRTLTGPDRYDAALVTLWAHYTVAAARAQKSLRIDDAYEAGKAWAAWLNAFAPVPAMQLGVLPPILPVRP